MTEYKTDPRTAEELREAATAADTAAQDSFFRSDTDGFMSQFANTVEAQRLRAEADLKDSNGLIDIDALFLLDGTVASTHHYYGQFGWQWVLNDEAAEILGKRFLTISTAKNPAKKRENNAKKGIAVGTIRVAGYVVVAGGAGGPASVRVSTRANIDALKAGLYEVITTDKFAYLAIPEEPVLWGKS